jgi:hypothetical protein
MNPGIQATIITIVFAILVSTGWWKKTLEDAKLTPRRTVLLLGLYLLLDPWTFASASGLKWNVGGLLLPLLLALWALCSRGGWAFRLQWLTGVVTVSAALIVLMTLVPLDPAFFLVDAQVLFPLSAVVLSVCSIRRPFVALSIAVCGMAAAAFADPLFHGHVQWSDVEFGNGEVRDLMAYTAVGVLLFHGPYHACARYVLSVVKNRFGTRRTEGGPEHA